VALVGEHVATLYAAATFVVSGGDWQRYEAELTSTATGEPARLPPHLQLSQPSAWRAGCCQKAMLLPCKFSLVLGKEHS
jgi:hypothetical protein